MALQLKPVAEEAGSSDEETVALYQNRLAARVAQGRPSLAHARGGPEQVH